MKDRLTYEETEEEIVKYLLKDNVTFKLDDEPELSYSIFDIFVNNKKRKDIFLTLDESYHFVTLVFKLNNIEEYKLSDADLFAKVSKVKKEYEDNKIIEQEKKNFKLLKLLKGE